MTSWTLTLTWTGTKSLTATGPVDFDSTFDVSGPTAPTSRAGVKVHGARRRQRPRLGQRRRTRLRAHSMRKNSGFRGDSSGAGVRAGLARANAQAGNATASVVDTCARSPAAPRSVRPTPPAPDTSRRTA